MGFVSKTFWQRASILGVPPRRKQDTSLAGAETYSLTVPGWEEKV